MNYRESLKQAKMKLEECGIENAAFDALQLMLQVREDKTEKYPLFLSSMMPEKETQRFSEWIGRRCSHEPLQYILGEWDFFGLSFRVGKGVLIPRPETEALVEQCALMIKAKAAGNVYDLCAGTGCIGIALASVCEEIQVWCFEKYDEAFSYLEQNIPENIKERVHPVQCDIFDGCPAGIPAPDFIVSNPPYVSVSEMGDLEPELAFEPETALVGGEDGLNFYRVIAEKWLPLIRNHGMCGVELGENQSQRVMELFRPFGTVFIRKDLFGVERFVFLHK